ncbi:MAG: transglycosylase domain-containing protein [Desulfobulbaceae bacterium]|nr:transglycosylase domain-containing protein [Desulfobulbaceae bacterium]
MLVIGFFAGLVGFCLFYWLVVFAPGEDIRQSSIDKILAVESPIMYSGGQDQIGVFFETSHRQYVSYDRIPRDFINSIVSSEDNKFFAHHGFDLFGVLRALVANVRAGRVVQGGSTITQQTAKNLFKRKDRSILSKLKELLFALRLEYHYPKEKILEFYANQFYVSGNGRGFGVAARYYFNKDAADLDLLECAFIAGSVKRPNYYNPFISKGESAKTLARQRSKERVKYVLGQMLKNDLLTADVYDDVVGREVPFEQGKMYFSLNTIMDMVKEAMAEPEIVDALKEHGIDNVATSGIKIITSIEKNLQAESFTALRQELSRLDVRLRGYERDVVQDEYLELTRRKNRDRGPGSFHFGRIVGIEDGDQPKVWVSLSESAENPADEDSEKKGLMHLPDGYIDKKGLKNLVVPLVKYEKNRWTEVRKKDLPEFMARLSVGDLVYASVRRVEDATGEMVMDLEKYPLLQGGVLAMRDGMIKAMVGGMDNRYFNRAIAAKRSMGSVVKPLVYTAALQLGWNSIDVLNNERDVFVYQKQPYFPRPDHQSPYKGVSMSWAGVHSENIATIWLLSHLCDRLTPGQFRNVVDYLGLSQLPEESDRDYQRRIRDKYGVVVDDGAYYEAAFERAIAELEPDLIFAGRLDEYEIISKLNYGRYFNRFFSEVDVDLGLIEEDESESESESAKDVEEEEELSPREKAEKEREIKKKKKEAKLRKTILKRNLLRFRKQADDLKQLRSYFHEVTVERHDGLLTDETSLYLDRVTGNYIYFDKDEVFGEQESGEEQELPGEQEELAGDVDPEDVINPVSEDWEMVGRGELAALLDSFYVDQSFSLFFSGQPLSTDDAQAKEDEFWDSVLIDNSLAAGTVDIVSEALSREYEKLHKLDPYGAEFLYNVRDFRTMVALQYLIGLCRSIGIESDLAPVLSFPLGSNVMSLLDVARAYESLLTGVSKRYSQPGSGAGLAIIESIENLDGEVIYEPTLVETEVVAPEIRIAISDILRRVIKFGTGRYADRNVRLRSNDPQKDEQLVGLGAHVPLAGKTGTANNFMNASFAGGVPGVGANGIFSLADGYFLTSYVGFDDNKPMVRNTTHLTGASGSLPLWARVANKILLENDYASRMEVVDISFSDQIEFPLYYPDAGQVEIPVDPGQGGIASIGDETGASLITFGEKISSGRIKPTRFFKPYWLEGYN